MPAPAHPADAHGEGAVHAAPHDRGERPPRVRDDRVAAPRLDAQDLFLRTVERGLTYTARQPEVSGAELGLLLLLAPFLDGNQQERLASVIAERGASGRLELGHDYTVTGG
jgi:hypothetical protein